MCGIVGIVGHRPVVPQLLEGLERLEYRGYDSSGLACLQEGRIACLRAEGKLKNLVEKSARFPLSGTVGIGHTRWATHGRASERNAHPHISGKVALVHNGIIENFVVLREELSAKGYQFASDTDTEIVAHLVSDFLQEGQAPLQALQAALRRLKGAFALCLLVEGEEDVLFAARQGPPLVVGMGRGENYVGSDVVALAPFTRQITYLEDGDCAVVGRDFVAIYDQSGAPVERKPTQAAASFLVSRGDHRHFMHKEMVEQPEVLGRTLARYVDLNSGRIKHHDLDWMKYHRVSFSSCGTAFYATLVARYWFERFARLSVDNDVASEFRYREPSLGTDTLAMFVSQSGETADTLAAMRYCRSVGCDTAALVNVEQSTMAREADAVFATLAGPEIGVASTKAFTAQLVTLAALALDAASQRGQIDEAREKAFVQQLVEVPRFLNETLRLDAQIEILCHSLMNARHALYLGRGTSYPIALEGALKLKELSYIHAEGYAAGELKHGPIALIDDTMPMIAVAPSDRWLDKMVSNMQEVVSRGGHLILITDAQGAAKCGFAANSTVIMPDVPEFIAPIIYALPMQLIAYHTALLLGTDVDQPRNLAKSVTVE